MMAAQIKTAQEVKRGGDFNALVRAGSKLRRKLNAALPASRAQMFMAIDAEREALQVSARRLTIEAGVSDAWYRNVRRANGANVSARLIVALMRAIKSLRAAEAAPQRQASLIAPALQACLASACEVTGADITATRAQLRRSGEITLDPEWRKAARVRRLALYLASTELGIRGSDLAQAAGMTPAAVSIALNKIESARDDEAFDAACDRAAELVRGK